MRILVTGGSGFIGSNFIKHLLRTYKDCKVTNLDKLTYAGKSDNLSDLPDPDRYCFVEGDINDKRLVERIFDESEITAVVHFAAESHVDRSFANPSLFVKTNTLGTQTLLEVAARHEISKFVHVSTDEVYGALSDEGYFDEQSPISPNNPYAASKAGADLIALSYFRTYGTPVNIVRFANTYGPNQHPEKLIPMTILCALEALPIKLHGRGNSIRDWLHVYDNVAAIDRVLAAGTPGEIYNIGASQEVRCLDVVRIILDKLGKSDDLIEFVPDRISQDYRYANDSSKIRSVLKWVPVYDFESGIEQTIRWYQSNRAWWKPLVSGGATIGDDREPEATKELVR